MKTVFKFVAVGALAMALAPSAEAAKYKVMDVKGGGSVKGKVSLGGAKAQSKSYTISKNPEVCGSGNRDVPFVRANGDALLDAVVYLDKVKEGKSFPSGTKKITMDQAKCAFAPYLSVMQNGGELEAVNSDPVLHNIHTYELIGRARRTVMNVSQPEKGNIVKKKIKLRKGTAMKVECDAHDFMRGYVFVARNPYYAVVNGDGTFLIDNIPSGTYTIRTWHGTLGEKQNSVTVGPNGKVNIDFHY